MPRGRTRKATSEVIRVRESDAQKLRQLQLKTGLKSIADAMTLMTQQYVITMRNGHLISRPNTLESVTLEVDLLSASDNRFIGWQDAVIEEAGPGEFTIASKMGSKVTVPKGMQVSMILLSA